MEGYKPTGKKYNVTYRQYPGLTITAKGTTIGKLQKLMSLKMTVNEENKEKVDYVFRFFVGRVMTWNLVHPEIDFEDEGTQEAYDRAHDEMVEPVCPVCGMTEGQPLPTTVEALYCLELEFILSLIFGWMAVIASVSDPKEPNSNSGEMTIHTQELMTRLAEMQSL
jgi:hypothetical protein